MSGVGFIGLGHMGLPMALNLAQSGYALRGYDVSQEAKTAAQAAGLSLARSLQEVVSEAEIVVTMLPDGKVLSSVLDAIIPALGRKTFVVDCSTIHVDDARQAHGRLGPRFLEAPVSGGVGGAVAGRLTFIAGGDAKTVDHLRPVLMSMGDRIVHCGGPGSGQAAKICNNMLLAITMVGTCEALAMGKKCDLDPRALFEVLSTSTGACWSVTDYFPMADVGPVSPADRQFAPGFPARMMVKDMTLTQQTAETVGQRTPLGELTLELYRQYAQTEGGDLDFSSIIKYLEAM